MNYKIGDKVIVTKSHINYTYTIPGSYGTITHITEISVNIIFDFVPGNYNRISEWCILKSHISPLTKLHKNLYDL